MRSFWVGASRIYPHYFLDLLLLISALAVVFSSYVVWFLLSRGIGLHGEGAHCSGYGVGPTGNPYPFMGWFRYNWIDFHNWAAVVALAIVVIHIVLHWRWVVVTTRRLLDHLRRPVRKVLELYGSITLLLSLFFFECLSGLVLWLVMPRGERDYFHMTQGLGRTFLGMERYVWVDLHAWVAVTIVSIIVIHLTLNWDWVVGTTRKLFRGPKPAF